MTDRVLRDWHAAYPLGLDFGRWAQALRWFLSRPARLEHNLAEQWIPIGKGCAGDLLAFVIAEQATLCGRLRVVLLDGTVLRDVRLNEPLAHRNGRTKRSTRRRRSAYSR